MATERERLERLAAGIVDGEAIDWKEATRGDDPESTRSKLESLRAVKQLREFAVSQSTQDQAGDGNSQAGAPTISQEFPDKTVILRLRDALSAWIQRLRRMG